MEVDCGPNNRAVHGVGQTEVFNESVVSVSSHGLNVLFLWFGLAWFRLLSQMEGWVWF